MRRTLRIALISPWLCALLVVPFLYWGPRPSTVSAQATKSERAAERKTQAPEKKERKPDVIFVPTPQPVVDKMLEMAEVKKEDVLYDLGCGDGRIVVTAAKRYGAKATGIDIDPERIRESLENVRAKGVAGLVTIRQDDIFETDLSKASVVTLYLLPELNVRLMPRLKQRKPGTRIVSHDFDMRGAKPRKTITVRGGDDEDEDHTIYLWVVPWEEEK
jgi:SAM-dependent methyltransferase